MYFSEVPRKLDPAKSGNVFWKELFLKVDPKLAFKEYDAKALILAQYFRNSFFILMILNLLLFQVEREPENQSAVEQVSSL